jgi:hypothetical protein
VDLYSSSPTDRLTDSIPAERVGFEPTVAHHHTAFRERHLQPLGHLSNSSSIPTRPCAKAPERRWDTAKPPGSYRAACSGYAWQDSNLRPLGPQPNALSPELQARIDHFTPMMQRSALGGSSGAGREGFEPSERFFSAQPLSRRPHSTTLAPPQVALSTAGQGRRVHRKPDGKVYHGAGSRPRFNRPSRRGKTPP